MGETDNKAQGQRIKISKYAITSMSIFLLNVPYWFIGAIGLFDVEPGTIVRVVAELWAWLNIIGCVLCPILSIKALREIKRSNGQVIGKTMAVIGLFMPIVFIYMSMRYFPSPG